MSTASQLQSRWGTLIGELKGALDRDDEQQCLAALDRLGEMRERQLYRELREMSARLRRALNQFQLDPRLLSLAGREIPDARMRLDHALRLTEEAAHRTLDLVEMSAPLAERTAKEAASLASAWGDVRTAAQNTAGGSAVVARMDSYLTAAQRDCEAVRANLSEVLITQAYQDISSQIIRSVMKLVAELEQALTRMADGTARDTQASPAHLQENLARGVGPAIPGVSTDTLGEQQDVDALLAANGAGGLSP